MNPPIHPVVLLVEDHPVVRAATADALTESGYEVLEAENADEALHLLAANERVDLLFTDLNLTGDMTGLQLSEMVAASRPDTKLVVTSGQRDLKPGTLPGNGVFLSKPYRHEQICRTVKSQLDS